MARKTSTRKGMHHGLLSRVYSPIHHTIMAAKNIVDTGLSGIDNMGMSLVGHANGAVRNVFTRKSRKGGRRSVSRKSRKVERKTRKSQRKSRKSQRK